MIISGKSGRVGGSPVCVVTLLRSGYRHFRRLPTVLAPAYVLACLEGDSALHHVGRLPGLSPVLAISASEHQKRPVTELLGNSNGCFSVESLQVTFLFVLFLIRGHAY